MSNLRLFIAVNFDNGTKEQLLSVQDKIKAQSIKGNFTRSENLHLTLVFLGETPEENISTINSIISKTARLSDNPFTLNFSYTGCFKRGGSELWWIGADHNDLSFIKLTEIRKQITDGLTEARFNFDSKPFKPHITLAREIKRNTPIILTEVNISIPINRISLMKSGHTGGKLVYSEVFGHEILWKRCV